MNKALILVVEDDRPIRNLIVTTLKTHDYKYLTAENGASAIMEASSHNPDIVLLDLGLPDMEGVEVIKKIRTWSNLPIIVVSARSEDTDKIEALDAGADDYLTKPFSGRELLARLRVMLRRNRPDREPSVFRLGPIVVDLSSRRVEKGKEEIHLTSKEYGILRLLLLHQGKVMTHRQLLREIWGPQHEEDTHYLRVHIAHLRQKLGDSDPENRIIRAESGLGYRIVADGAE